MSEQAILVIIDSHNSVDININTEEMCLLCESAKVSVSEKCVFKRNYFDLNYFIGKGQAQYLSDLSFEIPCNVIIFSEELSPGQIRNLEKLTDKRVIDRTQLILDIFAQRAQSNEGKIQVELAQLEYLLPRLTGKGIELSRIGGGAGVATRGPGETKLETDKRKIKEKIHKLKNDLLIIQKQRNISNKKRMTSDIPSISIVGYTSAGKSTLLSSLSNENFYTDSMLFATLDSVTRKINLNKNNSVYISDTVGFLQKLPHNIIAAFKSTLNEISLSDLIIHLIDSTKENTEDNINTVEEVLQELNANNKNIIKVFNKIDIADRSVLQNLYYKYPKSVFISAKNRIGFEQLLNTIQENLEKNNKRIKILIPYENKNISLIYKYGKIINKEYSDNGIIMDVSIPQKIYYYFQDYII